MDFENLHGSLWLCLVTVGCVVVARGQGHAGGCYTMSYTMGGGGPDESKK